MSVLPKDLTEDCVAACKVIEGEILKELKEWRRARERACRDMEVAACGTRTAESRLATIRRVLFELEHPPEFGPDAQEQARKAADLTTGKDH